MPALLRFGVVYQSQVCLSRRNNEDDYRHYRIGTGLVICYSARCMPQRWASLREYLKTMRTMAARVVPTSRWIH